MSNKGYTKEQIQWLLNNIDKTKSWENNTSNFNKIFNTNKTTRAIKSYCNRTLKIYTGYQPEVWNKGITKDEWKKHFSKESLSNITKHNWKKGDKTKEKAPIGTIIKLSDNQRLIKIDNKTRYGNKTGWYPLNRYIWEQTYNEKLNKNDIIINLDGNPENCDITNLYKTSREICSGVHRNYKIKSKTKELKLIAIKNEELKLLIRRENE